MSASASAVDRRPVPTVAIVGNDAVLAAAPATPVQLAHACLRRGFSVAVPASWGDELIAAETVRQLATRERGPAVMCVCPYVRSRLLAPGPDLAPFLVSLVSPPIAAARYLRAAYGEHGVHITYIGGCPSSDDATIDARLTPDDFLAELAEHGISLSEQPLVFDSIVPPDRRRWSSLPGGVPGPEALWAEDDTRTLIEIDRDDASTDLAEHILAREHVLLDLAPGFGCACSGAVGAVPARSSRGTVTALEPPRALGPILDQSVTVALAAPVGDSALGAGRRSVVDVPAELIVAPAAAANPILDDVLDELLGLSVATEQEAETEHQPVRPDGLEESDAATTVIVDEPIQTDAPITEDIDVTTKAPDIQVAIRHVPETDAVLVDMSSDVDSATAPVQVVVERMLGDDAEALSAPVVVSDGPIDGVCPPEPESAVRRRTPATVHARYSAASIPKATGANGRPLPRAYVAKRRTPPSGATVIAAAPAPGEVESTAVVEEPPAPVELEVPVPPAPAEPSLSRESEAVAAAEANPPAPAAAPPPSTANEPKVPSNAETGAGDVATAPAANQGTVVFLLVTALVALGVFVLFSLRR
jgi:hypothetical protein